jgi:5'-methylthioadenosine phosphorylase
LEKIEIGIIGGSGLYAMPGLTDLREQTIPTPFGDPSDAFMIGSLDGRPVAFLARHGRGHRILPSELNFRANLWAMKSLGVEYILSVSAVGSLKEEHKPTDFVIPDQFIDRTFARHGTFFGDGIVAHVGFGDPVCAVVANAFKTACDQVGVTGKLGGTYINMEGPQFSTRAESNLYRSWGADVIGMTNLQEAKLAREAEMSYATLAMVTDYDCWREGHDDVTVEQVVVVMHQNSANAGKVVRAAVAALPQGAKSPYADALKFAMMTDKSMIPTATKEKLALIIGKYL